MESAEVVAKAEMETTLAFADFETKAKTEAALWAI